jgi:hypothetical protein
MVNANELVHGGLMWSIRMRQENSVSLYAATHAQIHVYMGVCVCFSKLVLYVCHIVDQRKDLNRQSSCVLLALAACKQVVFNI